MEREWVEKGRKVRWEIIGEDVMEPIAAGLDDAAADGMVDEAIRELEQNLQ